jgi:glycosyltransferase involved in cell wall biosynthesis
MAVVHHPLAFESGLSPGRAAFLRRREAENLAIVDHVLVPSPLTASVLRNEFGVAPEKVSVGPPGFDPVAGARQPVDPPLILSVGILHPRKGHDILIAALSSLLDLDWQAVIAGRSYDADYAGRLTAAAESLQGRVRLAGEVDAPTLQQQYRSATLLALATRYEGYGMVFGEALRFGLPIVSCRAGAVPDTVPAEAGLLVPPDDPGAFADALRRVLTDRSLAESLAAGSAKAGRQLPTWDHTADIAGQALDRLGASARI